MRRCLKCNYRLESLRDNRCPECGTPFDPSDFRSFFAHAPGTFRGRRALPLILVGMVILVVVLAFGLPWLGALLRSGG